MAVLLGGLGVETDAASDVELHTGSTGGANKFLFKDLGGTVQASFTDLGLISTDVPTSDAPVDVSHFAALSGIEIDTNKYRLAAQAANAGIAGGAGALLSLDVDTDNFTPTFTGAGSWNFTTDRLQITCTPYNVKDAANQ